ncbi:MAG: hypothetical protein V7746_04490 [Halioglobus sp.]
MYRYSVDNAVTYASEDFVLYKESPFACWMERLTLENPDHGIPPDVNSDAPQDTMEPQDDLADTLRAEGKNVTLVEWDLPEPVRRSATLEAMRHGTDFIVNGQLALGTLSGSANLLMRTSGYSDLGDYLYVPCNTQPKTNLHSALRLCFLADLLQSLQGQLPPQMLIIRGDSDVVPLQTEDHIYHFQAVKERFMAAQQAFRKHKMPDPAASAHFGRWSDCANEVLRQRALKKNTEETPSADSDYVSYETQSIGVVRAYNMNSAKQQSPQFLPGSPVSGVTLAEQASMLAPQQKTLPVSGNAVDTLESLAFIGSSRVKAVSRPSERPSVEVPSKQQEPPEPTPRPSSIPSPNLEPVPGPLSFELDTAESVEPTFILPAVELVAEIVRAPEDVPPAQLGVESAAVTQEYVLGLERRASDAIPRDDDEVVIEPVIDELDDGDTPVVIKAHPLDSPGFQRPADSFIDLDATAAVASSPVPKDALEPRHGRSQDSGHDAEPNRDSARSTQFNDSLNTSGGANTGLNWDD